MNRFYKIVFYLFFGFATLTTAKATHLMGGWAGYQYLGLNASTGNYKYLVTVKVYRYCQDIVGPCGSNACNTAGLDPTIQLGAYIQDFLNPNALNKVRAASFTIPLTTQAWVPLPGAAQCATAPVVCVEEGIYSMQVELPPSNGGYHLIFERCCRNANIINLSNPGAEGMTYYAFVPPTYINNSSPTFALPPVPYICAQDTASILNTAFDPDGDVIVYSLVHPYKGYSGTGSAAPAPPNPYTFPIPLVTYAGGYSSSQPFGAGGYASVNSFTGLSKYLSPATGNYVVAVELQEYRNNQLIGITRLDIQIIVINCPPNNAPVLSSTTSQTGFVVNVGDTLCFPITFTDANGDSVFLSGSGTIFNPPTNPAATLTPNPNAGQGSITSQFCWNLACGQAGNYIFIVQSPDNGCPPKITNVVYTIQVLPFTGPSVITGPTPLCANTSGTYSVPINSANSYTWTVTGGAITSGQGTNSINVNWGSSGNGTVNVTSYNKNGCAAGPISMNVTIQAPPVVNAGPNATVCKGSSVTLTSSGGGTYTWSPSTGLNNSSIANPVASPTATTGYVVTVTSSIGCTNTGSVSINVLPGATINSGGNKTLCVGNSVTLGGSPTGPIGSTYVWSPSTGLNNSTLANPIANPTSTTTYSLVVTDASACTNNATVNVQVNPYPIANAGNDITVCPGFNTTLSGTGGGTYSWSPAASLSNPTISNPVASPTTSTNYTLVVTLGGCSATDFVNMTTLPFPAVNAGADVSICIGQSTTLNAGGVGTFVWSPATALSCTSCISPVANPTSTINYTLTITDANTCTNTDVVQVVVNPLPVPNAGPRPGWVCSGFSFTMNAFNGVSYSWSPSTTLNNPNISNPVATPTANITYTVTVTDAKGCSKKDTLTIQQSPIVPTNAGNDVSICIGNTTTLGGSPTSPPNVTYLWSPATGLNNTTIANPVSNPTTSITYTLTTTSNTCNGSDNIIVIINALPVVSAGADVSICIGNSSTLTGSGASSYLWNTGSTATSIVVSPSVNSSYTVTGTDASGCSNIDSAAVFVNALPVVSAGADVSICIGNSSTLTGSGASSYLWNTGSTATSIVVSPSVNSSYTVTGTDAIGCSNVDTVQVFILALPVITTSVDTAICIGDTVPLFATGGVSYNWSPANTLNNPFISNPVAIPTSNTTYSVVVTNSDGCTNTDTIRVNVNPLPIIDAGVNTIVCPGSAITLNATGGLSYSWSPAAGLNNTTISNPSASPSVITTYTVVGTDVNGCSNSDFVTVSLGTLPTANFGYTLSLACEGMEAQFMDSSLNATGWQWNFGDGNSSTIQNPSHTFVYGTNYNVVLTALNPPCSHTVQTTIAIDNLSNYLNIESSNVFTPNNDGINDCFKINTNGRFEGCANLTIYNRWGVQVFYSAYSGSCWDGRTSAGIIVPEGTYFYTFELNGIQLKGFITVLR